MMKHHKFSMESKKTGRPACARPIRAILATILIAVVVLGSASCAKKPARKANRYPVKAVAVQTQPSFDLRLASADTWLSASLGTPLLEGDTVWSAAGSDLFFLLGNGARMAVLDASDFRLGAESGSERVQLSRGQVALDMVGDSGPSVSTPAVAVSGSGGGTSGASFSVKVAPGGTTEVLVAGGNAVVENGAGKIAVPAGARAVGEPGKAPVRTLDNAGGTQAAFPAPEFSSLVDLQVTHYFRNEATRDAAEDDARARLAAAPDDLWSHINLGRALVDSGNLSDARPQFDQALEQDAQSSQAFEGLGRVDLLERKWKDATDAFTNSWRADRTSTDAVFGIGQAALGQADLGEAEKWYKQNLEMAPGSSNALVGLGVVKMLRQDISGASTDLKQAVGDDPSNAGAYPVLAMIDALHGDLRSAQTDIQKAIDADTTDADSRVALGIVMMRQGEFDLALAAFKGLIDSEEQAFMSVGYQDRGAVQEHSDKMQVSLDDWTKAYDLAPERQSLLIDIGEAHDYLKDYDAAAAAFAQAVTADQNSWYPHEWLARAYLARKAYNEAITEAQAAITLNPSAWVAHLVLGLALDATGAKAQAKSELTLGHKLQPSGPTSASERILLGQVSQARGGSGYVFSSRSSRKERYVSDLSPLRSSTE